jgi:metal-sulfur cluster biosynthetic enzyme
MWLADKLQARYGETVQVQYFDLFDPGCPPLPPDAQLPLVMIDDAFISRGGKISQPAIRAHLEAIGLRPVVTEAEVRARLDGVIHPSFGLSLVALGMVRAIHMESDQIKIDLVMNCPGCPAGQAVLDEAYHAVQTLAPDFSISLSLLPDVWRSPWEKMFG